MCEWSRARDAQRRDVQEETEDAANDAGMMKLHKLDVSQGGMILNIQILIINATKHQI